ncbi:MAG: sigma-70 family RNA polymerase sigma factor [Bdellovibrionaceae bacterium]|nr:sigma-70 family RNA polymerase sigma factor [Pseudobdellovibrionaceae bacterium]
MKIARQKTWSFPLNEEEKLEVKQIAMKLPADERAIVYLKYWLGMGLKHIAQILGMELYDVKVTHAKALSLMREELLKIKSA